MRLDTGLRQPAAIRLYERAGYQRVPNWPPHDRDPDAVCYVKDLRPLLFLDVDGTLLPFTGPEPDDWDAWQHPSNPALATLDRAHGPRLLALPCSLVWATAWMADANSVIAPLLGLPELPVASFPDEAEAVPAALHWKTAALVALAAGRPFAWVDDEITDHDRFFVEHHHTGRALLHRVDSATGLSAADFAALDSWLRDTPSGS